MVNIEIVEGLKEAMDRGESLKQAMFSFYNAGYGKQEIEDSAKYLLQILQTERQKIIAQRQAQAALQKPLNRVEQPPQKIQPKIQQQIPQQFVQKTQLQPPQQPTQKLITSQPSQQITPQIQQQIPQQQAQKVSDYNQPAKSSKSITIILLVFILVVLFGALVAIFLFKDQVIEFFNNLF